MTWLEAAIDAASQYGLQKDVKESYYKHLKSGQTKEDSAHFACYDWDIFISQNTLDKVSEDDSFAAVRILEMLSRRPCSFEDICSGLGLDKEKAVYIVEGLCRKGRIQSETVSDKVFYKIDKRD